MTNARDAWWNDRISNKNGDILKEFIEKSKSIIISPGRDTFSCTKKDGQAGGSVIDLIICSEALSSHFECCSVDETPVLRTGAPGRGHWPVKSMVRLCGAIDDRKKNSTVYSWKDVEWEEWSAGLDEALKRDRRVTAAEDPNDLWQFVLENMVTTKDQVVPKKTVCSYSRPFWTASLTNKSDLLRDAQKTFSQRSSLENREVLDQRRDEFTVELKEVIDVWTKKNSENLNTKDKTDFWKAFKRNFRQLDAKNNKVDILQKKDGSFIYSDAEKAEEMYDTFFTGNHLTGCEFDEEFKTLVEEELPGLAADRQPENEEKDFNEDYSMSELDSAIKKVNTANKTCDGDGIHPAMIKHMGPLAKSIVLRLFNMCLHKGIWAWRTSKVIFLKKAGKKNYQKPGAYRPICLSSNLGKLLERHMEPRMRLFMIKLGLIDDEQEGFMHHKSTTRYLYRLMARINSIKNNKGVGLVLMVDFEKAFDSVWVNGLLYKLHQVGWTGRSWRLIAAFLLDRNVNIKVGGITSPSFMAKLGLPQGSIISPLLFIFIVSEMVAAILARKYKFADDASLLREGVNKEEAIFLMRKDVESMFAWTKKWRFKVNCDKNKTELIPINFTPGPEDVIKMGGSALEYTESSKVLGIFIDKDSNWNKQVAEAWKNIKGLCSKYYGLKMTTIVNLVKISVIPIIFYAAPAWLSLRRLEEFHDIWYDILKTVTGSSCKPALQKLEIMSSLTPLEIQMKIITTKFLIKNFVLHKEDLLTKAIEELRPDHRSVVHLHCNYLKEYYAIRDGTRSSQQVALEDHMLQAKSKYTKTSIWNYTMHLWERQTSVWDDTGEFRQLISNSTLKTPCSRATEVYLMHLLSGHVNLNKFLWNIKKVKSPLCECEQEDETPDHVVSSCQEFKDKRENIDNPENTVAGMILKNKDSPESWRKLCVFISYIAEVKQKQGRKQLRDYFPEKRKTKKKKRGKAVAKESTRG